MISNFQSQRLRRLFQFGAVLVLSEVALVLLLLGLTSDVLADGGDSPSCLTSVNDGSCLTLTAPTVTETITVDGVKGAAEPWADAPSKNLIDAISGISTTETVEFLVHNGELYLFIDLSDTSVEYVDLWFDTRHWHNEAYVVRFRIFPAAVDPTQVERVMYDAEGNTVQTSPSLDVGVSGASPYKIEIEIEVAHPNGLAMTDLPPILGFAIECFNDEDERVALWPYWPLHAVTIDQVGDWANLKTRYPIEYMVVLDQSGSMLSYNKWEDAKKASNLLADTFAALAEPMSMYFNDRLGVATFAWDCYGIDALANRTSAAALPLAPFPSPFPVDYTSGLSAPAFDNCTPIGEGLKLGFTEVGTGTEETERFLLLLSDGFHNRPSDADPLSYTVAHLGYNPCPTSEPADPGDWSCESGTGTSNVTVHSVAFGPESASIDWAVATQLLQNIATRFSGRYAHFDAASVDKIGSLEEIFITSPGMPFLVNELSSTTGPFTSTFGNQKLIVIQSWATPGDAQEIAGLQHKPVGSPDGAWAIDVFSPCVSSKLDTTSGYAICVVNNPGAATYRAVDVDNDPIAPTRQFVLVDLSLRARFGIDRKVHGTGKEMILTVDLNERGIQMTEAAGYTVMATVEAMNPGQGLGQFLSTHTPDCQERAPDDLKPPEPGPDPKGTCPFTFGSSLPAITSTGGDPLPPLFGLAAQTLTACKEIGLELVDEQSILTMLDDGRNGDAVAGDGIYSARIVPEHEGSHVFRFSVEGTTPTGGKFTRTKLMAQYVRLEVDPAHTDTGSQVWWEGEESVIEEFYIIPRDVYGQHLGPGHADQVRFATPYGEWTSPVHDYGNGIYARLLKYNKGQRPRVECIVQDESITPCVPKTKICEVIISLIVVLLIIVSRWLLRRRQAMKGNDL